MRQIKKKIIYFLLGMALFFTGILEFGSRTVWAGDINGDEAGVIGAASGTFTYKGKKYRAYSGYINQLYSYLASDDVDLSPGQAQRAISYIYSHVETGIARGYIYEIGGESDPDVKKTEASTEDPTTSTEKKTEKKTEATEAKTEAITEEASTEGTVTPQTTEAGDDQETEDIFSKIQENQNVAEQLNNRVKPEDAEATAIIKDDTIVIDTGDGDPIELDSKSRIIPASWPRFIMILGIVTFALTVFVCLFLILKRCMRFGKSDRRKPLEGHRKRRRIRKYCRRVLTVTTAVSIGALFLLLAISTIIFNNDRILQSVQESGYFRYAYIEYLSEQGRGEDGKLTESTSVGSTEDVSGVNKTTTEAPTTESSEKIEESTVEKKEETAEKKEETVEKPLSYDAFVIREKQAMEQLLLGNRDVIYQKSNVAPYVLRLKEDLQFSVIFSGALLFISLLLGCIFTIFMDLRRDRGIRMIAVSELIGTGIAGVITILLIVLNPVKHFFIEPDYLFVFFKNHIDRLIQVLSVISVFGLVTGMALVGLYFSRRKAK